ncbi:MAG TPA: tyrosine-type recombinase/integrase, partial [Acidobacteriota bacterium]|nr:tyrosine-type recombinase/integrase [Acidobacteriota bacterium]
WLLSYRSYLTQKGVAHCLEVTRFSTNGKVRQGKHEKRVVTDFRKLYDVLATYYDDRVEYEKDIWDLKVLGKSHHRSAGSKSLNLTQVIQPWLRESARRFFRYAIAVYSTGDCLAKLQALNRFSRFLATHYPQATSSKIDRNLLLEYLGYLLSLKLADETRAKAVINLRIFLEMCGREGWGDFIRERLIYDEEIPRQWKKVPRFIPQPVQQQIRTHLNQMVNPWQRMVLILQECGMRISELLTLPLNCLVQDSEGDYFIIYYQGKMYQEHRQWVSRTVAEEMVLQQEEVRKSGISTNYLFPNAKGESFHQSTFQTHLNQFLQEVGLKDAAGHLCHITAHMFRHTVATNLVNAQVPLLSIKRHLGHRAITTTERYTHIYDETVKQELTRSRHLIAPATGELIERRTTMDDPFLQLTKKDLHAQALGHGWCAFPVAQGPCPHANACFTCKHWRTDRGKLPILYQHLAETEQRLHAAQASGAQRMVEMNQQDAKNLKRAISILETLPDDEGGEGA